MDTNEVAILKEVQEPNLVKKNQKKRHSAKPKAVWDARSNEIFVNLCVAEKRGGNRPNMCFNKLGWNNIVENFAKKTGKMYDRMQLKNRYDVLKKEWILWDLLVGRETGLGWDHEKQTVTASDEWWEKKIQKEEELAKFRVRGLDHCFLLDELFLDVAANGARAWAPNSGVMPSFFSQHKNDEVDAYVDVDESSDSSSLEKINDNNVKSVKSVADRKKRTANEISVVEQKGKKGTAKKLLRQLDRIIEVVESKSKRRALTPSPTKVYVSTSSGCTIEEAMIMLDEVPEVNKCDQLYMLGTRLFMNADNREMFKALKDPVTRYNWLKQEERREYATFSNNSSDANWFST